MLSDRHRWTPGSDSRARVVHGAGFSSQAGARIARSSTGRLPFGLLGDGPEALGAQIVTGSMTTRTGICALRVFSEVAALEFAVDAAPLGDAREQRHDSVEGGVPAGEA